MVEQSLGAWLGQLASKALNWSNPVLMAKKPAKPAPSAPTYTALPVLVNGLYNGKFRFITNLKPISCKNGFRFVLSLLQEANKNNKTKPIYGS